MALLSSTSLGCWAMHPREDEAASSGEPVCGEPNRGWTIEPLDPTAREGLGIQLSGDRQGVTHVVYRVSDGDRTVLRHATEARGHWDTEDVAEGVHWDVGLAIDSEGTVHVGALDWGDPVDGSRSVRHFERTDAGWSDEEIGRSGFDTPVAAAADSVGHLWLGYGSEGVLVAARQDPRFSVEELATSSDGVYRVMTKGGPFLTAGGNGHAYVTVYEHEADASGPIAGRLVLWEDPAFCDPASSRAGTAPPLTWPRSRWTAAATPSSRTAGSPTWMAGRSGPTR